MSTELVAELVDSIDRSLALLAKERPGEKLVCYALATDDDVRFVGGVALTDAHLVELEKPEYSFMSAEWLIEHNKPFKKANATMSAIADGHYASEGDEIGPDDDHLRPWKKELFRCLVEALLEHRRRETFGIDVFVVAESYWPNDHAFKRIDEATKELNSTKLYKAWRKTAR